MKMKKQSRTQRLLQGEKRTVIVPGKREAKPCRVLLQEYLATGQPVFHTVKLKFGGVGNKDVYNITAPFIDEGEPVIAGRVEDRDSESSQVMFFVERGGVWVPRDGAPTFELQDPFYSRIHGELIVGGVQTYPDPLVAGRMAWRTVFYRGERIVDLRPFLVGPDGMKDIRLVELADGSIGVFTRPQGQKGGRGKIGFTRIKALSELSAELIEQTPILENLFVDEEWGGANEAHLLANGLIGVLGHIACFDEVGHRHYYPMVFALNPETGGYTGIRLIAVRAMFLPGAMKRPDVEDVVFSGGLIRKPDGTADLYAGVSDAEAHRMTIPDPFLPYERGEEWA